MIMCYFLQSHFINYDAPSTKQTAHSQPVADPYQAMLMQKLMREEQNRMNKQSNRFKLWKLTSSWMLVCAAFGVLAFVWFTDKPIVSGNVNPGKFERIWPGVLDYNTRTMSMLKMKWYFDNVKYERDGGLFGHTLAGKQPPKTIKYSDFKGDDKGSVDIFALMMFWGSLIPICLLGAAAGLFTLRFCLKSMRYKLTAVGMIFVGLATMGPMVIVFDVLYTFNGLPIFNQSEGQSDAHSYGFKYAMTFWANIVAFGILIVLEIFNVCS